MPTHFPVLFSQSKSLPPPPLPRIPLLHAAASPSQFASFLLPKASTSRAMGDSVYHAVLQSVRIPSWAAVSSWSPLLHRMSTRSRTSMGNETLARVLPAAAFDLALGTLLAEANMDTGRKRTMPDGTNGTGGPKHVRGGSSCPSLVRSASFATWLRTAGFVDFVAVPSTLM